MGFLVNNLFLHIEHILVDFLYGVGSVDLVAWLLGMPAPYFAFPISEFCIFLQEEGGSDALYDDLIHEALPLQN